MDIRTPPIDDRHTIRVILNRRIRNLHAIAAASDIEKTIADIADIISIICRKKQGDIYMISKDIFDIIKNLVYISQENKIEIIKDIVEYIMVKFFMKPQPPSPPAPQPPTSPSPDISL